MKKFNWNEQENNVRPPMIMSTSEVAAALNLSPKQVRKMINSSELNIPYYKSGNRIRINFDELCKRLNNVHGEAC